MTQTTRPRVAVAFGGRSNEHEISCVSAAGILAAIDRDRYDVLALGVTRTGRWLRVDDAPAAWAYVPNGRMPEVAEDSGPALILRPGVDGQELLEEQPDGSWASIGSLDVVFPVLHGPYGEDGSFQGLLELSDVRYVGSGVAASANCMDKHLMKSLLTAAGMPVGSYAVVLPHEWARDKAMCLETIASLGLPVFVKPARAGSSVGITKVHRTQDLEAAIAAAQEHDPKIIVESMVEGREIECAVLDTVDGLPEASVPAEIEVVGDHEFYDYQAKYLDPDAVRLLCPTDLPDDVSDHVRRLAVDAFLAAGCEGMARVDVFVTRTGDVVINEINTLPGCTPVSMFPRMWHESGLPYPALVSRLLDLALHRPVGLR